MNAGGDAAGRGVFLQGAARVFSSFGVRRSATLSGCCWLTFCTLGFHANGENRSLDGTGNNLSFPSQGAANTPVIRITYRPAFANGPGGMLTDAQRPNARTISNSLSAQTGSIPSARGLSDYVWAWGQFLDHDMSLSTSSNGAAVNGSAPIAINDPNDPLGPSPIPFIRSNFVPTREQVNEVTSYIDASQVYGSNAVRAAALRTDGGVGAKLTLTSAGLLPLNTAGLPNDNDGPLPDEQMFLAGDVRANENVLLTSLQTVFAREHNRLVDRIAAEQPALNAEEQYQLARKLVGAEMQIITYREFLPALLGSRAPRAEAYRYSLQANAAVTNSFAHSAYRFGHSTLSPNLKLLAADGTAEELPLRHAFFNPSVLSNDPAAVDELLLGAAKQTSQEVDVHLVDDVRNFLFGPPGAGGLDLAALNIQRGRDHGLPNYNSLRGSYKVPTLQQFSQITADPALQQALSSMYGGNIHNVDSWVGGMAEDHLPGSSVGPLIDAVLNNQFTRTRDGDRLFYLSAAAGLYDNGVLKPEIAALIDLDALRLSDVIEANSEVVGLQNNVFFVFPQGDFDQNGVVDGGDLAQWQGDFGGGWVGDADGDDDGDGADFLIWQRELGRGRLAPAIAVTVPEPSTLLGGVMVLASLGRTRRRGF
jgi:hypothetical protein